MHLECQTGMRYTPVPCGEGACRRRRRPDPTCQKSDVFPVLHTVIQGAEGKVTTASRHLTDRKIDAMWS